MTAASELQPTNRLTFDEVSRRIDAALAATAPERLASWRRKWPTSQLAVVSRAIDERRRRIAREGSTPQRQDMLEWLEQQRARLTAEIGAAEELLAGLRKAGRRPS